MAAFRKFDPYTFLADRERGGAPSEAAAETSETLAPLAREHPQDENKRSEDKYGTDKWVTHAEAVKFVKAVDDGTGILATLANLAPVPSENDENEKSEPPIAKAANPSTAHIRGTAEGLGAKRAEPTPAKATKPANPSEPALLAPGTWFDRFGPPGEPPFDQPCPSRRGLIERQGRAFLHFCVTCGAWGAFGYGVTGRRPGRWYCGQHRPKDEM